MTCLGEDNPMWKGDQVGYNSLHQWVKNNLSAPELCQICHEVPPKDLANITNIYNRNFKNWMYICRKCHMRSDGRIERLHSEEIRKKAGNSRTGNKLSEQHKRSIRLTLLGRKDSKEIRERKTLGQLRRWRNYRNDMSM